jgi:GcrA cell cycle regulator
MAFPWDDRWQSRLGTLAADGLSASQIGRVLTAESGFRASRNAVIGRIRRTNIKQPPKPRGISQTARWRARKKNGEPIAARPIHAAHAILPPLVPDPCSILRIGETRCRWPLVDWPPYECRPLEPIFCGAAKMQNCGPYCAHHAFMAAAPVRERRSKEAS